MMFSSFRSKRLTACASAFGLLTRSSWAALMMLTPYDASSSYSSMRAAPRHGLSWRVAAVLRARRAASRSRAVPSGGACPLSRRYTPSIA